MAPQLTRPPIAVAFLDEPPAGLERYAGSPQPSGCSFWRLAQEGRAFYTVPSDHFGCAVGSFVARIDLPPERSQELPETVGFMVANRYIEMSEIPGIPRLDKTPAIIAYAPVESAPYKPDVVLVAASPAIAMLLYEAALRAGAGNALANILGRPGCAVLPLTQTSGAASLSLGCKGNRTYTGLPDGELYIAIPGSQWDRVLEKFDEIRTANAAIGEYHEGRKAAMSTLG